jgi:DNA-binding transcriptional LysR family regulator
LRPHSPSSNASSAARAASALSKPPIAGNIRFGTPDDYALRILPRILGHFALEYPQIEVAVRCETSTRLIAMIEDGSLDLALITRAPGRPAGELIRREPVVWACSARHQTHERDPVPLALFQEDCAMRELAIAALVEAGRKHRLAYSSPNLAALLAVTAAGLAIAALPRSSVPETLRILGPRDGFPDLPEIELAIVKSAGGDRSVKDALAAAAHAAIQMAGQLM